VHPALQSSYRAAGRIGHFLIAPLFNRDPAKRVLLIRRQAPESEVEFTKIALVLLGTTHPHLGDLIEIVVFALPPHIGDELVDHNAMHPARKICAWDIGVACHEHLHCNLLHEIVCGCAIAR
jgi:hypothetical protein